LLVGADRHPPAYALVAPSTRDRRDHLDPVAGRPTGCHVIPGADHLAGDLVPHHPGRHDVVVPELEDLHVGTAGGAVAYPHLHVTGTGLRLGHLLDAHVAGGVEAHDLHQSSPRPTGASRASTWSGSVASRNDCARSGSSRIWASSASIATCPSPRAAIA